MTRSPDPPPRTAGPRRTAPVQRGAGFLAIVSIVAGVLGFVPGATRPWHQLALIGPASQAELFGLVRVSVLVNVIHLAVGAVGLRSARRDAGSAVRYLIGLAVVFFAMAAWGVETRPGSPANLLPVDDSTTVVNALGVVVALLFVVVLNRTGPDVTREVFLVDPPATEPPPWRETPVVIADPPGRAAVGSNGSTPALGVGVGSAAHAGTVEHESKEERT